MGKVIIVLAALIAAVASAALLTGSTPDNISPAVAIPANGASNWVSRTPPPVRKKSLPLGARRWFGDTNAQATR